VDGRLAALQCIDALLYGYHCCTPPRVHCVGILAAHKDAGTSTPKVLD